MNSTFRICFYGGALFAIALGLWLVQLWSATNQVRLHSEHLLRQIENRKWGATGEFVAVDYRDDWGDDRALLLQRLRLALQRFSSLTISADAPQIQLDPPIAAIWNARIQIAGSGADITPEIIERVNSLTTPFELRWRKQGWQPWDWKLIQVRNPSLKLPADAF